MSIDKAFADLVWLSERLSGIIAVKDEIKKYSDLKNQSKELAQYIEAYKQEAISWNSKKEEVAKELEQTKAQASEIIKEAKVEAKKFIDDAKTKVQKKVEEEAKILRELADAAEERVTLAEAALESLVNKRQDIETIVSEQSSKLDSLNKEIERLKAKLQ